MTWQQGRDGLGQPHDQRGRGRLRDSRQHHVRHRIYRKCRRCLNTPLLNDTHMPAILWTGYSSQSAGTAILNVSVRKSNPAGRSSYGVTAMERHHLGCSYW